MQPLSRLSLHAMTTIGTLLAQQVGATASSIYACPIAPASLQDMQVYTFDGQSMTALTSAAALETSQRTHTTLYFVVKLSSGNRKGATIIKTARLGPPLKDDLTPPDRVRLRRYAAASACDSSSGFHGTISTKAYASYHDLGNDHGGYLDLPDPPESRTTALEQLQQFHTQYEATDYASPRESCRRTDDKNASDGTYEARSNRSQFSFVTSIVDHGISGGVSSDVATVVTLAGTFFGDTAYAAAHTLRERRVEIKPYQTTNGVACIPFIVNTRGTAQVLRVNDLDRREQIGSYWARVREFRLGPTEGGQP